MRLSSIIFFFQAEDGIRDDLVTGVQTCALPISINTSTAKVNQPFDAVVIAPVVSGDGIAIAAGVHVTGHIKELTEAVKPEDQAILALSFDRLVDAAGKTTNLTARLAGIDNARESLDADGRILGIIAAQTGSGRLDQGINKVAQKYPGLADLLGTVKQSVVKEADPNIDYEPGVEMTIEVTKPLQWTGDASAPSVAGLEPQETLSRLVLRQPFRTTAERPPTPSDMTNLMFICTQAETEQAFASPGWS